MKLKYIGNGNSIAGVPARDLEDNEVKNFNIPELIESGLYQFVTDEKPKKSKSLEAPISGDGGE